jgi:hypothetical protein
MVKVLRISPLKSLEKSSHPNLTYLEGKGKQKEEEKFVHAMKGKEKAPEKESERMISAGGVMNE